MTRLNFVEAMVEEFILQRLRSVYLTDSDRVNFLNGSRVAVQVPADYILPEKDVKIQVRCGFMRSHEAKVVDVKDRIIYLLIVDE